jgi:hypothetical protein
MHCQQKFDGSAISGTLEAAPTFVDDGWEYREDVPGKFGYISNTMNSTLACDARPDKGMSNLIFVHYLKSYSPVWGKARIETFPYVPPSSDGGGSGGGQQQQSQSQPQQQLIINSRTMVIESQLAETVIVLKSNDDRTETKTDQVGQKRHHSSRITITIVEGKAKIVEFFLFSCSGELNMTWKERKSKQERRNQTRMNRNNDPASQRSRLSKKR